MFLVVFTEVQKFSSVWLFLLLAIVVIVLIRGFVAIVIAQDSKKIKLLLLSIFLLPIGLTVLTLCMQLQTRIDASGIYYRFYPVHIHEHKIDWSNVDSAYVCTYRPVAEYGGWGIRRGCNGRAYNAAGDQGLQIVFKNGKRLLLGTQKPQEIKEALSSLTKEGAAASVKTK
jgi:hypothetical protein